MTDRKRLGLGCMKMDLSNRARSVETVRCALDEGVTLLNTGDFYGGGESELVLREALSGVPRDRYFLSVKFGVLPKPGGGIYGLDVDPFHVKAHLAYSLHRLGLDYIDLYEPARMDESVPVEELIGALEDCVREGYVRHIGLTQLKAEDLARAAKAHPIHTVELDYSLANRSIEKNGVLRTAEENGIRVLAFGVLSHGAVPGKGEAFAPALAAIAEEKGTTLEKLLQAYVYAKHPDWSVLVGTTRREHLLDALDALTVELTAEDVRRIEDAFPQERRGGGMSELIFRSGRMAQR